MMKAECITCFLAIQETVSLRRFLRRLDVINIASNLVTIYCDSMAALAYANDPKYHGE